MDKSVTEAPDTLSALKALTKLAEFNNWLDIRVISGDRGEVELHLPWRPEFAQYNGYLHASIVGGLIDTACGFAAFSMTRSGVLASQFSVRCLRPALASTFVVRGRVVKRGRQQIFTEAQLYAIDAPEKLFATGDAILVPAGPTASS